MKRLPATPTERRDAQHGAAAVEFALVAIPFFLLLLGTMEFGRLLYLWNTVQEVTRHAARQAVVTNFNDAAAIAAIKRSAVFRATDGTLPASSEISNATIEIKYLNAAGGVVGNVTNPMPLDPGDNIAACLDAARAGSCIRFVEVSVCTGNPCVPVSFSPMIGLFSRSGSYSTDLTGLLIPMSTVRMPAESLGFSPAA